MSLESEVEDNRQSIRSDGYAMSVGEVLNLYRDEEIVIRPEFQRLFRWDIEKQSRLIESLLLDIPVPPVFVAQREDGIWEVVDGLQRLSTILKFMGELREEATKEIEPPSTLVGTRYLPSLDGATYSTGDTALPASLRLQLKRARLDFKILLRESDEKVKFELFDRLNSGGQPTSPQEVRTALLLMKDTGLFGLLDECRRHESIQECLALTERQLSEQYDLELIVRFLVFDLASDDELKSFRDIDSFLTEEILAIADRADKEDLVQHVFDVFQIISTVGPNAFRKYDSTRGKTVGAFSVSAYEAVTAGVSKNLAHWQSVGTTDATAAALTAVTQELWEDAEFLRYSGAGVRATTRAPRSVAVGERLIRP